MTFYFKDKLSFLSFLLINLYQYGIMESYSIYYYTVLFTNSNSVTITFILMLRLSTTQRAGAPSGWLLCPFHRFLSFFEYLLAFRHSRVIWAQLVHFLP